MGCGASKGDTEEAPAEEEPSIPEVSRSVSRVELTVLKEDGT